MRAVVYIVLGFILDLTATTRTCTKEENVPYYIYNVNVSLKAYHCVIKSSNLNDCTQLRLQNVVFTEQNITERCMQGLRESRFTYDQIKRASIILCESEAKVKLLENEIKFTSEQKCQYDKGYCLDSKLPSDSIFVYWPPRGLCNDLQIIFDNKVDIWTVKENNITTQYITSSTLKDSVGVVAMELVKNERFCHVNLSETNVTGILASREYIGGLIYNRKQLYHYRDQFQSIHHTIKTYCEAGEENKNQIVEISTQKSQLINSDTENSSSKWYYIYNFWTTVKTYHCFFNISDSCKQLKLGKSVTSRNITENCIRKRYNGVTPTYSCGYYEIPTYGRIKPTVCENTESANLLTDEINLATIESKENYSTGYFLYNSELFPSHYILWSPHLPCTNFKVQYNGIVLGWDANQSQHIIDSNLYSNLKLVNESKVCNVNAWITDRPGIVVSRQEIHSYTVQTDQNLSDDDWAHFNYEEKTELSLDERLTRMKIQLYYLIVVIIVCILYIGVTSVFNIYVNFLSLCRAGKKQESNSKLYVLNCLSQSLTNRYLFLDKTPDIELDKLEKPLENPTVNNQQLYEYDYVDINLHNK